MPIKTKDREYRNMLQVTVTAEDINKRIDSDYYVEGYATTWDTYLLFEMDGVEYFERIDPRAFDDADFSDIIMQYDHSGRVFARSSNETLIVEPDEHGLFICADLSKSEGARELYKEIKEGLITKMSWAFTASGEAYDRDTRTRSITKVKKIYDVSAVSIPANDTTEITARSFVEGVINEEHQELMERERQLHLHTFYKQKRGVK